MREKKTDPRSALEGKIWFRLVKVIYIGAFALCFGIAALILFATYFPQKVVDQDKTLIICDADSKQFTPSDIGITIRPGGTFENEENKSLIDYINIWNRCLPGQPWTSNRRLVDAGESLPDYGKNFRVELVYKYYPSIAEFWIAGSIVNGVIVGFFLLIRIIFYYVVLGRRKT